MQRLKIFGIVFLLAVTGAVSLAQGMFSAVEGKVKRVDATAKTIVVETGDGVDHTLHYAERTIVRGANSADQAASHDIHAVGKGTTIVAHYFTAEGKDTVAEIDRLGEDGLQRSAGTIDDLDRGKKKLVLKATDGTETTFQLSDHAAIDAGTDIKKSVEKSTHVTVYYTQQAGKKVAHFFETST
jgi:hypothetical protein